MRKEIKTLLMFLMVGMAATVFASEKIYDPMDVFKRDVPPNILISVDNSGSMARDVNGTYLYDMRYGVNIDYSYSRATTGDFWHCNYPDVSNTRDPIPDQWDNYVENLNTNLGYSYNYASIPVAETGEVEYVALAVDVWKPSSFVMDNADVELMLTKGDVSKTIMPTLQWYKIKKSIGSSYYYDTATIGGNSYIRYRMTYVFKDFYEMEKSGTWRLAIRETGNNGLILDSAYLHFNPMLSKMTILKVVLQRLIANTRSARLALGMYGSKWTQNYRGVTDGNGIISDINQYVWIMNTSDGGFKPLVGWPTDPIDTQSNHEELLDWVNFDAVNSGDFDWGGTLGSPTYTREMMARGGTPIGLCLRDVATYVNSESSSSLDPSTECRNYSVIFMTDGYCTSGDCSDAYVHTQLQNIYEAHTAEDAAGNLQGVKTYIIGFALGNSSTLDGYAEAGHTDADGDPSNGAQAYAPNNSKELLEAFENAIAHASIQTFTGETQVMPIKLDPDLQNTADANGEPYLVWQEQADDAILQSYFTYSARAGFTGHFKAYGILKPDGTLLGNNQYRPIWDVSDWEEITRDANGQPLVTEPIPRRGTVASRIEAIRRYLTPDVTEDNNLGGANTPVPFRESFRCIVTPSSTTDGATLLYLNKYAYDRKKDRYVPDAKSVTHVMDTMGITTAAEAVAFLDFLQTKTMGDTTYSTPAVIGAADSHYPDDSYSVFEAIHKHRQKVVYVGSNDGMLHCLDAHTGDELWAFIPADLFPRLSRMWEEFKLSGDLSGQPDPTGTTLDALGRRPHHYYLASSPRYTDIREGSDWMTILTIGEGAGGNAYTTLNVTDPTISGFNNDGNFYPGEDNLTPGDPHDNPSQIDLMYGLSSGSDLYMWSTASGGFSGMGETWSTPSFTRQGLEQFIGYFGSGYPGYGGNGNTLYAVDLSNGEILDSVSLPVDRSIFCSPGALIGFDDTVYSIYFGDTKGGIWRYVPDQVNISNSYMEKIFQSTYNSTIMDTPALLLDTAGIVWISTGEMGEEAGSSVVDNSVLYTVKDDAGYNLHPAPVYTAADMVDLNVFESSYGSNTVVSRDDVIGPDDKGYFYQLLPRETLTTSPIITGYSINELSYITTLYLTYRYPEVGNYCNLGDANLYIFGLNAMFISDEEGDGNAANLVGEGKPGSPFESESGEIWLNTPSGPVRVINAQGQGLGTGSASQDINAQKLGRSGGWYTK